MEIQNAQTCGDRGCDGAKLLWLCIEDSISLSESSLPERVDITLLVIHPGPIEKNISEEQRTTKKKKTTTVLADLKNMIDCARKKNTMIMKCRQWERKVQCDCNKMSINRFLWYYSG